MSRDQFNLMDLLLKNRYLARFMTRTKHLLDDILEVNEDTTKAEVRASLGVFSVDEKLDHYSESYSERSVSGPITVDPKDDGHVVALTLTGDTEMTLETEYESGRAVSMTLIVFQDSTGGHALSFPTATRWNEGEPVEPTQDADAVTIYTVFTVDGGNIWYAFAAGLAMDVESN